MPPLLLTTINAFGTHLRDLLNVVHRFSRGMGLYVYHGEISPKFDLILLYESFYLMFERLSIPISQLAQLLISFLIFMHLHSNLPSIEHNVMRKIKFLPNF